MHAWLITYSQYRSADEVDSRVSTVSTTDNLALLDKPLEALRHLYNSGPAESCTWPSEWGTKIDRV
jgi:hypothetical protein